MSPVLFSLCPDDPVMSNDCVGNVLLNHYLELVLVMEPSVIFCLTLKRVVVIAITTEDQEFSIFLFSRPGGGEILVSYLKK